MFYPNNNSLLRRKSFYVKVMIALAMGLTIMVVTIFLPVNLTAAEQKISESKSIELKSRSFMPTQGLIPALHKRLSKNIRQGNNPHVFVQFKQGIKKEEKAKLEKQGLHLLSYLGSNTWYASITNDQALNFTNPARLRSTPVLGKLRWMGEIQVNDKISKKIREKGVGEYNRNSDGTVNVVVIFFCGYI